MAMMPEAEPNGGKAAAMYWRSAALAMLSVRFVQGFIYWGGGSRRFFYAPGKLDPDSPVWMANKLQTAIPGALFGVGDIIKFLLLHFWLLYPAIIVFSAVELVAGLMLITGTLTRLAALATVGLSILLMIIFGWQGGTCLDEWTMAACNLAMGVSLLLIGSSAYSIDNVLARKWPRLMARKWFVYCSGHERLPLSKLAFEGLALISCAGVILFVVGTYDYYRGSVWSAYHAGPVSPSRHHYSVTNASVSEDGSVSFTIDMDGGTSGVSGHIMAVALSDTTSASPLASWDMQALSRLDAADIVNTYEYNQFKSARFGLAADVGAEAVIKLPPAGVAHPDSGFLRLSVTDVAGNEFSAPVQTSKSP